MVRLAEFELDLRSGELRMNGTSVKVQPQPNKTNKTNKTHSHRSQLRLSAVYMLARSLR